MEKLFKNTIIQQAIELGFDFGDSDPEMSIEEIEQEMMDFFNENSDLLESIEDECEVTNHRCSQSVVYGDYWCSGEIVNFSDHWHKPQDTKIYHSDFVMEEDGVMKKMNLYYLVGKTDYN